MPTLIAKVIQVFQEIGRREQNAALIDLAAQRLRGLGMAVQKNFAIEYSRWGCPTRGQINLWVVSDRVTVAVEVDRSRPRRNSRLKLQASDAHFKLVILTSPGALAEPQELEGGIVVVALNDALRRQLPPMEKPQPAVSELRTLSARLRRAIELFVDSRDVTEAARLARMEPAEFRRLLNREDVRSEFTRKAALLAQARADLRAYAGPAPKQESAPDRNEAQESAQGVSSFSARARRQRIERRADIRQAGRTPAKGQYVYAVRTTMVAVPDWLLMQAVPGILSDEDLIWLRSRDSAYFLARLDREAGGKPHIDRFQARKCQLCGLLKIGIMAQERARLDQSAVDGRKLPCSPECLVRAQQHTGRL